MKRMSEFNEAAKYANAYADAGFNQSRIHDKAVFAVEDNESVYRIPSPCASVPLANFRAMLDETDLAIVEEVARSKNLVSIQIYQYLGLRGFGVKRPALRNRINKLVKFRVLREYEICRTGSDRGIRYYELDYNGYLIAQERGVVFHMGNRFLSDRQKAEQGVVEDAETAKRILAANMVVLGLLRNGAALDGFAFNETIRVTKDTLVTDSRILRTQGMFWIGEDSVFLVEAVRSTPHGMRKLADKVQRYYALVDNEDYLQFNVHGHKALPQLVLCAESLEHARKIDAYLRSKGLWSETDTIVYTHDLLYMKDTLRTFYELTQNGEQVWYGLPSRYVQPEMICA